MIRAEGVVAGFETAGAERARVAVLRGVDLAVGKGELVAVVGGNGSGKTTLLRVLAGLHEPWGGRVTLDGVDVATGEGRAAARRSLAFLFSNPDAGMVAPSAERELAFGLENRRVPRETMRARVEELLAEFDLVPMRGASPADLSGGERARLALAAALAPGPSCLLIDESLAQLDAEHRTSARSWIERVRRGSGLAVIWATQDWSEAEAADRVVVLREGRIARDLPGDLLADAGPAASAGLAPSPLARAREGLRRAGLDPGRASDPEGIAAALDGAVRAARPGP